MTVAQLPARQTPKMSIAGKAIPHRRPSSRGCITDDNLWRPTRRAEEHYTKDKLSTRRGAVYSIGWLCGSSGLPVVRIEDELTDNFSMFTDFPATLDPLGRHRTVRIGDPVHCIDPPTGIPFCFGNRCGGDSGGSRSGGRGCRRFRRLCGFPEPHNGRRSVAGLEQRRLD
jgi:hypothetical protein